MSLWYCFTFSLRQTKLFIFSTCWMKLEELFYVFFCRKKVLEIIFQVDKKQCFYGVSKSRKDCLVSDQIFDNLQKIWQKNVNLLVLSCLGLGESSQCHKKDQMFLAWLIFNRQKFSPLFYKLVAKNTKIEWQIIESVNFGKDLHSEKSK